MTSLFVGNAPLFVGNTTEVGRIVYLGLVERIGLLDATLAKAVAVAQLHLNGMRASLIILIAHLRECRIRGTVENPYRIGTRLSLIGSHHLVGLLVYSHLEVHTINSRSAVGICSVETVRRAGHQKGKGNSEE